MKKAPQYIEFIYEVSDGVLPKQEDQAKSLFNKAGLLLEAEWGVSSPIKVRVSIMSDEVFRDGANSGPQSWKYCFLLRDQPDDVVYCNVNVFNILPRDAEKMIKHETAHIVIAHLVGNFSAYQKSFFLEEGTAGLDGATSRLIKKIKKENIQEVPDPLVIKTITDIKSMGGDTNKEPFIDQLGYLLLFSITEYLRNKYGNEKIVEVYKRLNNDITLEMAFESVCNIPLATVSIEWKKWLELRLVK